MKNVLKSLSMLIFAFFLSCQNSENEQMKDCADCKTASYTLQNLKIGNNTFNVRNYDVGTINDPDFISINTSENKISEVLEFVQNHKSTENKIKGLILFSNYNGELKSIDKNNIDAFILYEENKNFYNTRIFKKVNGYFEENKVTNLKTNFISTNDFKNISISLNNDVYKKTIAIINFKNLKINTSQKSELQKKFSSTMIAGKSEGSYCYAPCQEGADAWCTASESQSGGENWWCLADPRPCATEIISEFEEQSESLNEYRNANTSDLLHSFRDNYLSIENGGSKYIDMYYDFSSNMDYSKVNANFVEDTFLLINTLRPKLEQLLNNKNSATTVIIDTPTANMMTEYLSKYTRSALSNEINF